MNKLYKNRFVMDKITGRTYQLLTSEAAVDGRRWVRTSRRVDRYNEHTTKKHGLKCQVCENQMIPLSRIEGIIGWEAERIIRGKGHRDEHDLTILALHKTILESKRLPRSIIENAHRGSC